MSKWLEENRRYNNFIRNRYSSLYEADRTRFISKNPNLSEEQKQEVIDTFKKYPAIDKDIKWGSKEVNNWTYEQFKPYLAATKQSKRQSLKNGLEGLKEGADYRIIKKYNDGATSYEILTYRASVIIASNQVPPEIWTPIPFWNRTPDVMELRVPSFGKPKDSKVKIAHDKTLFPGAKWCTAMQTSNEHWNSYTSDGIRLVYIIDPNQSETAYKKIAVAYLNPGKFGIFNAYDDAESLNTLTGTNKDHVSEAIEWLNKNEPIPRDYIASGILVLNKETNRYDCPNSRYINIEDIIENGKFKYPLGFWNGGLKCNSLLSTLENTPQEVKGDFDCSFNPKLTSLRGGPIKVEGTFNCGMCENLVSLEGGPQIVGGNFNCSNCTKLTSLKGAPKEIKDDFSCTHCVNLLSLEGCPQIIKGDFDCRFCKRLTSLKGAPQTIYGSFICINCDELTSLKEGPKSVLYKYNISGCKKLTSLEGAPEIIPGNFYCKRCIGLTSLIGAPKEVDEDFDCSECIGLTTLQGAPKLVQGSFDCSYCNGLTTLEGSPIHVWKNFICYYCKGLKSLEGVTSVIGRSFACDGCENLSSLANGPKIVAKNYSAMNCNLNSIDDFNTKVNETLELAGNPGYPFKGTN